MKTKTSYSIILATLIMLLILSGCAEKKADFGKDQSGQSAELAIGEILTIELESNPGTGYAWSVIEIDETVLVQDGESVYNETSEPGIASGTETLRFKAIGSGKTILKLGYRRSWEANVEPIETYELEVTVE